jgi:hypothetical protein
MEDQILDDNLGVVPQGKLYRDRNLWIATFLGGPLAAGYIIAENFKALSEPSNASKTWIYSTLISLVVLVMAFYIPASVPFPNQIIPIISIVISHLILTNLQGSKIKKHIEAGGQLYSGWRSVAIGLIFLVITIVIILGVLLAADLIFSTPI